MPVQTKVKRYSLVLPQGLFDQLESVAEEHHTTVVEVLRRYIKLGLLATKIEQQEDAALIIREGDRERELIGLF